MVQKMLIYMIAILENLKRVLEKITMKEAINIDLADKATHGCT